MEGHELRSACAQSPLPPFFRPTCEILNHFALEASNLLQSSPPHEAMYSTMGPVLCGHCRPIISYEARASKVEHTSWLPPACQWNSTVLPDLAGTVSAAFLAFWPQTRFLLVAPFTGLVVEI